MYITIALAVVVIVLLIYFASAYNRFVKERNYIKEAWSGIDVQLKRRNDLIPNLVESVRGYMSHENKVLENIARLRSRTMGAESVKERAQAEDELTNALKTLFAVAEAYPDLKANQNFLDLQGQLSSIENEIQYARRYYNGRVRDYNIRVDSFPSNLIANIFDFKREEFFEITREEERETPEVKF